MNADLPKYTRWDQVPAGLHTRTQLKNMTPPRKLARDAEPVAQVLYMGNKYTGLYRLADSVEKPPPSPAQLLAVAKAKAAQWVCKRCGYHADLDGPSLGRGRLCNRCRGADTDYYEHLMARRQARAILDRLGSRGVLIHATGMDRRDALPARVVAIAIKDESVLVDVEVRIGAPGYRAVLDVLHQVLTERGSWQPSGVPGRESELDYHERFLAGWSFETSVEPCLRLLNPDAPTGDLWNNRALYPWLSVWTNIQALWAMYRRELARLDDGRTPLTDIDHSPVLPGASGDAVRDALTTVSLLKAMACGHAQVAETAFFLHPQHGPERTQESECTCLLCRYAGPPSGDEPRSRDDRPSF